jgi:methylmalonyl-CoA mutase cobalamin-binding subunit
MSGGDRSFLSQPGGIPRVTSFARHVLGEICLRPGQTKTSRRDAFTAWLAEIVSSFDPYDQAVVLGALQRARLTSDDLITHCVPQAANDLGHRWACDEMGFARVSLGTARLHGLCHTVGSEWTRNSAIEGGRSILLATLGNEAHLIGASVLAYRLRRNGHSVRAKTQTNAAELIELLDVGCFDGLMLSCCNTYGLETVAEVTRHIKNRACVQIPIILGGSVLHEVDGVKDKTGVTLATNDINAALDLIGRSVDIAVLRVAE